MYYFLKVHFAAINCWQPGSECNTQYSKVYAWPVLMAYPAHGRGIQYKGPRTAHHMMKFLQLVMQPFVRITDTREIGKYRAHYDVSIIFFILKCILKKSVVADTILTA